MRRIWETFLIALARLVLSGFHRDVQVIGRERVPSQRPVLVVANHYNGFIDPVIVVHVLGRLPRFLAKSGLWSRRALRPFLWAAGMIPVHRASDGGAGAANVASFATTREVLARRGLVAIFPEGTTHDDPSLARIRTGAARIALAARAAGAEGLVVLPIGMAFADKSALRAAALAQVGRPLDLDAEVVDVCGRGDVDDTDHAAVDALTTAIEARLREVSPDYADRRQARVLARAAEIACRTGGRRARVRIGDTERLAQRLAYAAGDRLERLTDLLARYQLDLALVGLRDHHLEPGYSARRLLAGFVQAVLVVVATAVLWVPGVAVNAVPYWLVAGAGRAVRDPVMKGTARVGVALVVFPLTWAVWLWALGVRDWRIWIAAFVVLPTAGIVAVRVVEVAVGAWTAWRGWLGLVERRAWVPEIRADRDRVVEAVTAAAASVPPGAPVPPARPSAETGPSERIIAAALATAAGHGDAGSVGAGRATGGHADQS